MEQESLREGGRVVEGGEWQEGGVVDL